MFDGTVTISFALAMDVKAANFVKRVPRDYGSSNFDYRTCPVGSYTP